ncbi:unnamed protein product, partial [Prorocentrum cordatum]
GAAAPRMARVTVLPESEAIGIVDAVQLLGKDAVPPRRDPHTGQPAECSHVLELADGLWTRSLVSSFAAAGAQGVSGAGAESSAPSGATDGIKARQSQTRTSTSCVLRAMQTAAVGRIELRLASLAKLPVETLERPTVVRYAPGEHFNEHHDGKFRPRTVFVYLNDLPEDDPGGDTFFPHLGLSFRPRAGCAVIWTNTTPDGREDSRLCHCGRPPKSGVKFGINCFFNTERMRLVHSPQAEVQLQAAHAVDVRALWPEGHGALPEGARGTRSYKLKSTPEITAVPCLAGDDEVDHLLELAGRPRGEEAAPAEGDGCLLQGGTHLLRLLGVAESSTVEALEGRLAAAARFPLDHLGPLRLVRAGSVQGLCNRGCGQKSGLVCLSDRDEVFFPHLGLRLALRRGDALLWSNVCDEPGGTEPGARSRVVEDLRTTRVHLGPSGSGAPAALSLDVSFHDGPLRSLQRGAAAKVALSGG